MRRVDIPVSRRRLITALAATGSAAALAGGGFPSAFAAGRIGSTVREKRLSLQSIHTGEKVTATFWFKGEFLPEGLAEIDHVLRDWRTDEKRAIDPVLLEDLFALAQILGNPGTFNVISGYRSPKTNAMLASRGTGVARQSYHMKGRAIDIGLPRLAAGRLYEAAKSMNRGGVGLYASSGFVHMDTGPVRHW